ncbi:alpha-aminoadipic semialdehyde synthase, mitochondrial-like isoform X2 [Babylonia areolata]|uniref:alpha-aminoadipic semialdehyde synthase, mitochondrial-like isoform X2 n=1 Tax=Babylonia areolata TaxID=304850 RepID=UPI003FD5479E
MVHLLLHSAKPYRAAFHHWRALSSLSGVRWPTPDQKPVMAIRRETINVWERRAPLAPMHVRKLVKKGIKVIVQPSDRRAYSMQEYQQVGATVKEDLSEASLVIGVKQIPIDNLMPDKTYAFFSHTIKAQEDNMPLLDALLEKNIRLIDYEKMVDAEGTRMVAFGKYAGVSGMINILHGMGLRLLALGHHTPFMHIGPSHNYRNTEMARQAVRDAGYEIALGRLPRSIGPLTFIFTGSGNVSQGAQEVFQELPHEYIEPAHLATAVQRGATNKIYACVVSREDHYVRKEGGKFDAEEFEAHPDRYASMFSHKIAPYASCIINGIYWAPNSPRLLSIPDAKVLLQPTSEPWVPSSPGCPNLPHRLLAICDISADPGGSIEFMKECTTIDSPFCLYDAEQNMDRTSFSGPGVLICSIDNMPAQIPREATDFFGSLLLPHIPEMLRSNAESTFEDFDATPVVKNAVITSNGSLTPNFAYINEMRQKSNFLQPGIRSAHKAAMRKAEKKVLVLGAGYVARPAIEYLARDAHTHVTIVSQLRDELDTVRTDQPNVEVMLMDIQRNQEELERLIPEYDIVVSLLPYALHPDIAKMCIDHRIHMVTASYVSPRMAELHKSAEEKGVTILNEVGVDPGIDHMLAMQCFDEVKQLGGKITSYVSWCGGLPAPENSDSPLRYKFSWFPKGVLMNTLASARFLRDGKIVEIPGNGGLMNATETLDFLPGFNLEGFPNRDSTQYAESYGIQSADTVLRGTIRYKGFTDAVKALMSLGFLDAEPHTSLHPNGPDITWKGFLCQYFGKPQDILTDSLVDLIQGELKDKAQLDVIVNLGLVSDDLIDKKVTPIDTLSNYLAKRLAFGPEERDMILMHHDVQVLWPDGQREQRCIDLVNYGDIRGPSAMAKTVGLPTGIATKMVLDGEIQRKGVVVPFSLDIYQPMLSRLAQEGIKATEKIKLL